MFTFGWRSLLAIHFSRGGGRGNFGLQKVSSELHVHRAPSVRYTSVGVSLWGEATDEWCGYLGYTTKSSIFSIQSDHVLATMYSASG